MTTDLRHRLRLFLLLIFAMIAAAPAAQAQLTITSGNDYGTYSIGEVNLPLTATGGSGPLVWSIVGGALPPGLALRSDVPSWLVADAGLIGVATTPNTYQFDVQVTDGVDTIVATDVTVKITALRITTPYNLPDAYEGSLYSTQLSAADGAAPLTWSGTAPAGLSLASDGTLSGTPTGLGFWNVPLQVTDGFDTVGWSPRVGVFDVQITTNALLPYATINQPYSQTIAASGGAGGYTFDLCCGGLPNGLSFNAGTISGTPTQAGRYTFSVSATDTNNHFDRKAMSLVVVAVPAQLPQVQPYGPRLEDCAVGQQCQRSIGNWSAAKPPFSWVVSGLPSGMDFHWGNGVATQNIWPGDVELFGSPAAAGDYNITATVTDGTGATATNTFPLHVSTIYNTSNPPNGTINVPYSHAFRVIGGSAAYTVALTGGSLPIGLTLNGGLLTLTGTPLEGGSFNPEFTFDDGAGQTSKVTVYFYIANAGNTAQPLAINDGDLGVVILDAFWQRQLTACCRNTLVWTLEGGSSLPPGVSLSAGGVLSGTPTVAGQYTFVVRATDGSIPGDYTTRQLAVIVSPVLVTMNTTLPFGNVTVPYSIQLQASGGTGPHQWTLMPGSYLPPGLSLTLGGLLSGTPTGSGQFGFAIKVLDTATSNRVVVNFNLAIYPAGQYPPLNITTNGSFGTWPVGRVEAELSVSGGAGGYVWSLLSGTLPPGLIVRPDGPSYFSPSANGNVSGVATTPGTYNFTLRVTDVENATVDLAGSMTITALMMKNLWNLPDGFKNSSYSYTLTPLGNVGPASWSVNCGGSGCGLPPGLSLNASSGEISGIPTTPGFYNPRIAVTADGAMISHNLSISIYAINVVTSTPLPGGSEHELPNATQNQFYSVDFDATGCAAPCTFTSNSLPNGLSLDASTGVVSGTYTGGTGNRFTFRITATDASTSTSYFRNFAIRGVTSGLLPAISVGSQRLDDCTLGMGCNRSVSVSNGTVPPYVWGVSGLPPGMSIRPGGVQYSNDTTSPGDATLWGVPMALGDFNVTITATDATGAQGSATFPLHISELYQDIRLPNGTYGSAYGPSGLGGQLRIVGGTGSYSTTLMTTSPDRRLPTGLSLNGAQNIVTGTPTETGNFSPDLEIVDTANPVHRLRVYNFFSIAGQGVSTIQINNGTDLGYFSVGSNPNITFTACCVASYIWSLESGTLPPGPTLNANTGGFNNANLTAAGVYVFSLRARNAVDANNFAVRQFTMVVTSLSLTGSTTLLPGDVGSAYSQSIPISGATGPTVWSVMPYSSLPPGLSLSSPGPNGAGLLSGTPTLSGQFQFSLKVIDTNSSATLVRAFNLSIYPHLAYPPVTCGSLGPNLGTFTKGTFTQQLTCGAGGTGTGYTYAYAPGATPIPGVRVQQGPPLPTNFGSTTAGLLGVLTTVGTHATTIRVTDSLGNFGDRNITLTVAPVHILSQTTLPKAKWGTFYSFQLAATGGAGYSYALAGGSSLPNGLTLSAGGLISGTPTGSTTTSVSNFSVVLTAAGPVSVTVGTFSLTVNAFDINATGAPSGALTGTVSSVFSQTFTDTGCTGTCSWSVSNQPGTLNMDPATGVLSGTPTGTTSTTFTVTRNSTGAGNNGSVSRVFSLQIQPAAINAVAITSPSNGNNVAGGYFALGNTVASGLFATGGVPPYTWTIDSGALPTGLSIQGPGETLGVLGPGLMYIHGRAMAAGDYTFTLKATDSLGNFAKRTLSWTVAALNNQYTNLPLSGSINSGVAYSQKLLALGGTATGGTGNYSWANLSPWPLGLTLDPITGLLSGTTSEVTAGALSVPVQITDTSSSVKLISNVNITVSGSTTVSFTTNTNLGTAQPGSLFNTSIVASGGTPFVAPTPLYTLTVEPPTSLPPGFSLLSGDSLPPGQSSGSNVLSGIATTPGLYTFTLRATDSVGNFRLRTFTLTVVPFANATSTNLSDGAVGEPYSQQLLNWNAVPVTLSIANGTSLPPGLSLAGNVLSGMPTQAGTFSFSLGVTDASGLVVTANYNLKVVSFQITSPQQLPSPAIVGVPFTYNFTSSVSASWTVGGGLPGGFNLTPGGTLSGTLSNASASSFSFPVTATVGSESLQRRFTLYVRFPNAAVLDVPMTSTVLNDATVGLSAAYALTSNNGVPPYTWSVAGGSSLPPGLNLVTAASYASPTPTNALIGFAGNATLNPGGTALAGVPSLAGDYAFDLILTDGTGAQARRTFTLHVSPIMILQSSIAPATMGNAYSRQLTAAGGTGPYTFTMRPVGLTQEMLPPGLSLSTAGLLSGTPTSTGNYAFFLEAKDSLNRTFSRRYGLFVTNAALLLVSNFNLPDTPVGVGRRFLSLGVNLLTLNANGTTSTSTASGTFTWSLKAGSDPLPPGMSLLTGDLYADPGETILGGQPTVPGVYTFTLRATRASPASTVDHTFTFRVTPMQAVAPPTEAFIPADLPSAQVGTFFSTTLKVAGGAPPYSFVESPFIPLPSWLTLGSTGVLSGTPPAQAIGFYTVAPIVTDSNGKILNFASSLIVTAAAAAPPLLPIPSNLELFGAGVGVPFNFPLDLTIRGGTGPFTWSLAPGASLPPGLVLLPGANGVSSYIGGVPTTVSFPDEFEFELDVEDSGSPQQTLRIELSLLVTSLTLTPATVAPGIVGAPYSAQLTPSGGTGPYNIFAYPLESNFPPGMSVSPTGLFQGTPTAPGNFPFLLAVGDSTGLVIGVVYRFAVDNPPLGEAPSVFLTPTPIELSYRFGDPNPSPTPISVNATSGSFPFGLSIAGIAGATVSVGTGTAPGASSIIWNMAGLGIGTYHGIVGARAQAVNLLDQIPVVVHVTAPCGYSLTPNSGNAAAAGGSGAFGIATGGDCAWTAVSNASWITIDSASSGTGSGALNYTVAPNDNGTPLDPLDDPLIPRLGTITVADQVYSLTQFGSSCAFGINPTTITAPAGGGQATVTVTASNNGCQWTASGLGATWAGAPSPASGNGMVTVDIPVNTLPANRDLQATIAGLTFTVHQSGVACNVGLSASSASSPAGGGPGSVFVTRVDGCAYDTVVGPSWVSITSGGSHDDSFGGPLEIPLVFEVQPNSTTISRMGTLTIGGQAFQITQDGLACSVTLDTSNLHSPYSPNGGVNVGSIGVTANGSNCSWVAESGADWASISPQSGGGLVGTIQVSVTSNALSTVSRTTDLSIAGQIVSIVQAGTTCTYALQSSTGFFPAPGGFGNVGVMSPAVCGWSAVSNDSWLTVVSPISPPGSAGNANVLFAVDANAVPAQRVGTLSIRNTSDVVVRTYTVTQAPVPCTYTLGAPSANIGSNGTSSPESFTFTAPGGCTPTPVSYASWITVGTVGVGTIDYSVEANPTNVSRQGTIQVGNRTFTVNQAGAICGYSLHAYGAAYSQPGGAGNIFATRTAPGCPDDSATTQPSFISLTLPPTEDSGTGILTLPYTVLPYISLNPNIRFGAITIGGRVFQVKQTSW